MIHSVVLVLCLILKALVITLYVIAVCVVVFQIMDSYKQRRANEKIGEYDRRRR